MQYEISCGAVVFTRKEDTIYYVIVKSLEGYFGFPKGHVEGSETERQTALREIYEEVGIRPQLIEGFRMTEEHALPKKSGVIKRVIYFLASYENQELRCQKEELENVSLMTYEEAMQVLQFDNIKEILKQANVFLNTAFENR